MSTLMKLSATNTIAKRVMDAFNPDQPRDENGRWGDGGSPEKASAVAHRVDTPEFHTRAASLHKEAMKTSPNSTIKSGHAASARTHEEKAKSGPEPKPSETASAEVRAQFATHHANTVEQYKEAARLEREAAKAAPNDTIRAFAESRARGHEQTIKELQRKSGNPAAEGSQAVRLEEQTPANNDAVKFSSGTSGILSGQFDREADALRASLGLKPLSGAKERAAQATKAASIEGRVREAGRTMQQNKTFFGAARERLSGSSTRDIPSSKTFFGAARKRLGKKS